MSEVTIAERLKQEATLKNLIKETIDSICEKQLVTYKNICALSARSESDKNIIINDVFAMMTNEIIPSSLLGALSQVESKLDNWSE